MKEDDIERGPESMAGLLTHERVFSFVERYLPTPSCVIDLGAGEGAFSKKLVSSGHEVTAVDLNPSDWKLPEVSLIEANLDSDYSESFTKKNFADAVIAIEILEHVENPFSFVREAAKLLRPGGLLFLSTPNVESVSSRLIFLYTGRLKYFGEYETVRPAHITPIFRWKLELMLEEAGFEIVTEEFNRMSHQVGTSVKARIGTFISALLSPFVKGHKGGESRIIVAKLTS
jgi:2-polyprenyl-3-methyl-5-hydroxy-6-metoxy-1,4-benzoquinol methylase